jgi:hypothetical protein
LIKTGYNPLGVNTYCNLVEKSINEDLTGRFECNDIMKVYKDYTCEKLLWERKINTQLSEDEKVILKNISEEWKWIARDEDGEIWIYKDKPVKGIKSKMWRNISSCDSKINLFNHLFQFIKWEDEEPYLISNLLGGENNEK